jgi:hypothetical protein
VEGVLRWMDQAEEKGRRDVRMRMTFRVAVSLWRENRDNGLKADLRGPRNFK